MTTMIGLDQDDDRPVGVTREQAEAERRRLEQLTPRPTTPADVQELLRQKFPDDPTRRRFASLDWHG
jgi:hypothetical protein